MSRQIPYMESWLKPLQIEPVRLRLLAEQLSRTYKDLAFHSSDQFLATPITRLPTGAELGEYLAIDFGGSNVRIAFVNLLGSKQHTQSQEPWSSPRGDTYDEMVEKNHERSWPIEDHLKVENAEDLFAWVGGCLAEVVTAHFLHASHVPEEIPLGITFSFPMIQSTLTEAILMPMGKGFTITNHSGLGAMILAGYDIHTKVSSDNSGHVRRRGLPRIKITAIANDAVATLVSLAYSTSSLAHSKTVLGLILGTGCNAAVSMETNRLGPSKWAVKSEGLDSSHVVVNTEWTISGAAGPLHNMKLITSWDQALDNASTKPGFQPFEQMTAGNYLGEIVRLVVLDWFTNECHYVEACLPSALLRHNAISTTLLSQTVATTDDPEGLAMVLNGRHGPGGEETRRWTTEIASALIEVERIVSRRSAALVAAAIVGLLLSTGDLLFERHDAFENVDASPPPQELLVAYCGGLICQYRGYREQMQEFLDSLVADLGKYPRIVLREASEGGVIGAAVLSATMLDSMDTLRATGV